MLWEFSRKSFHLIRLDAQKCRNESHTTHFRSSHKIRILLWSGNKTEDRLNNKPTLIFTAIYYAFCHYLKTQKRTGLFQSTTEENIETEK